MFPAAIALSPPPHTQFSRKLSILVVSICFPPTYSSIHSTLFSTPYCRLKIASDYQVTSLLLKSKDNFQSSSYLHLIVRTTPLTWNHLESQDSVTWFSSHLLGSSISFVSSSSPTNMLEFLQALRITLDYSLSLTPIKNMTK